VIDQALLGYDQGHRLLTASIKLPQESVATLVAVSDTDVREGRRLAGVPLQDSDHYALLATWAAPEAGRPGAVWAHALLLPNAIFEKVDVEAIVQLLSRPDTDNPISAYSEPLTIERPSRPLARPTSHDVFVCAHALYASKGRVAHIEQAEAAEAAILALWSTQWPELQARCAFAVRSTRHRSLAPFDILVLTGERSSRTRPSSDDCWLEPLATELTEQTTPSITAWLTRFGPQEPPRTASVRALGRLWSDLAHGDVKGTAGRLSARYPTPEDHADLKRSVFGRECRWWSIPEIDRLVGLLCSGADAWDTTELEIEVRVAERAKAGQWSALISAVSTDTSAELRDALVAGLASAAVPEMLGALVQCDLRMASDLLAQSSIGTDPDAWRGLDADSVASLLSTHRGVGSPEIAAALVAGQIAPVIKAAGVRATLKAIPHLDKKTLSRIAKSTASKDLLRGADPHEILELAAAGARVPVEQRVTALEALRHDVNAAWLSLAVETLIDDQEALDVVFGPLHAAAVSGGLTPQNVKRLETVLPKGKNVPQRLRALLLERARKQRWSRARLAQAARGAGSQADRLLDEVGPKDPLQKTIKWLLSKAGIHF
jgi:GTPase-associated protein 1, N-terminal domain type 1